MLKPPLRFLIASQKKKENNASIFVLFEFPRESIVFLEKTLVQRNKFLVLEKGKILL